MHRHIKLGFALILALATSCSLVNPAHYIVTPSDGQSVRGVQSIVVEPPQNFSTDYVDFFINGANVLRDSTPSYVHDWDTRTGANGSYTLSVEIWSVSGTVVKDSITVYVDN